MSFSPSSPVTGSAITGLTSPTYTLTADAPPNPFTKQYAVTALGGTQTDVSSHSPSSPFILSISRPSTFKPPSLVNPVTGQLQSVPRNTWKMLCVKGGLPLAGQNPVNIVFRAEIVVPSGVEVTDPNEIRAMLSLLGGVFWAEGNDLALCLTTGIL